MSVDCEVHLRERLEAVQTYRCSLVSGPDFESDGDFEQGGFIPKAKRGIERSGRTERAGVMPGEAAIERVVNAGRTRCPSLRTPERFAFETRKHQPMSRAICIELEFRGQGDTHPHGFALYGGL